MRWPCLREMFKQIDLKPHRNPLQAIARAGKVVEFGPSTSLLLSRALQEAGDDSDAIDVLRVAVARYPSDVWTNTELGKLFSQANPPQAVEAIRYFTAARAVRPQSGGYLIRLLERQGREDEAETILRDLVRLNPTSSSTIFQLIVLLDRRGKVKEARSFEERLTSGLNEQLRQEPDNVELRSNLGDMLLATGNTEGAKVAWRMTSRMDSRNADCRYKLGILLRREGDLHGAVESFRETIAIDPLRVDCFYDLAEAYHRLSEHNEETATIREAIRAQTAVRAKRAATGDGNKAVVDTAIPTPTPPSALDANEDDSFDDGSLEAVLDNAFLQGVQAGRLAFRDFTSEMEQGHLGLGNALAESGDLPGAITAFAESIRLGEGDSVFRTEPIVETRQFGAWRSAPHTYLGNTYRLTGDYPRAIAAFREAVRLGPEEALEARYNLGVACAEAGESQAAVDAIGEAIRRDYHTWLPPLRLLRAITMAQVPSNAVAALRRVRRHVGDQEAIVQAIDHATTQYDRIISLSVPIPRIFHRSNRGDNLAELCYNERYFSASSAIWLAGFTTDPKLAEDMSAENRYNAACSAALAAAGEGVDKPPLDDQAKARWRRQALEWLKADLIYWTGQLKTGPPETRVQVIQTLRYWKSDRDLAGLRDEESLKKLREDARKECLTLWAEVDQLLGQTENR
jgi:tetratricopeptide (TPR) repeat protein